MSYLGFTKILSRDFLKNFRKPRVLEIGIDTGQTAIPLIANLSNMFDEFTYTGIDIKIKEDFLEQLSQINNISVNVLGDEQGKKNIELHQTNSLDWLSLTRGKKYDLILVDGDHNFYTVYHEISMLENFKHEKTLIVCDDYQGRYANKDMFYKEREEYKNNDLLHTPVKLEKQGVKSAIDYYVNANNSELTISTFGPLDPCFLYNAREINIKITKEGKNMRDSIFNFNFKEEK